MRVNTEMSFWDRLYIPGLIKGMFTTLKHIPKKKFTYQYPEDPRSVDERNDRYRGIHKLTKDNEGHVKCVACFMCATACPAHCITIKGTPAPEGWETKEGYQREKCPEVFEINMLRCIFCGYCVEACPEDAIQMTGITLPQYFREIQTEGQVLGRSRNDFIFDREMLLANNNIPEQGLHPDS
jgi:NADH-quinone oxidoreductase subunit I